MAKTATAARSDKPKKKKKAGADATVRAKGKSKKATAEKIAKPVKPEKTDKADALHGLAKFVDHPLVADLLAAGAIAAVAAIAEHQLEKKGQTSSKMVKSVGKAAATAMGRRLMGDIGAITSAAANAAKKA